MNGLNNLPLHKVLFYLSILTQPDSNIANLSLNNISIMIYGSIVENLTKEFLISELNERLNLIFQDHIYREELTFIFTPEEYPNINPNYYKRRVTYFLQKNIHGEISLYKVSI